MTHGINTTNEVIPEEILEKLGARYDSIEYVSSGATSSVFCAHDKVLDKKVAIKVLNRANKKDLIAFQNEAQAAAQLVHSNLVSIFDFGVTEKNSAYLILDFVDGASLERFIEEHGNLPLALAFDLLKQIIRGLGHAHSKNIAHRDLKTSNIMVRKADDGKYQAVVIDFGLACDQKKQVETQRVSGSVVGSPLYMSSEQADGKRGDERSDIYALGCIVYRMIAGKTPFRSDDLFVLLSMHKHAPPPALLDLAPELDLPAELQPLLDRMLQKDPALRYQDVQEILDDVLAMETRMNSALAGVDQPAIQEQRSTKRKLYVSIGIAVALFLISMGALVFFLAPRQAGRQSVKKATLTREQRYRNLFKIERQNFLEDHDWMQIVPKDCFSFVDDDLDCLPESEIPCEGRMNLSSTAITGSGFHFLNREDISQLDISGIKTISAGGFKQLSKLTNLKRLGLSATNVRDEDLNLLGSLKNLTVLQVVHTNLTDDGYSIVPVFTKLEELNAADNPALTDKGVAAISKCKELRRLNICDSQLTDAGVDMLLRLEHIDDLRLDGCKNVTGKGLKAIVNRYRDQIKYLGISFTRVRPEDLECLTQCRRLKWLSISGIPLHERELEIIGRMPHLFNLYMSDVDCSQECIVKNISNLKKLTALAMIRSKLTKESCDRLKKSIPKLRIVTGEGTQGLDDYSKDVLELVGGVQ